MKKNINFFESNEAITLIALVVTIIVLLILAGVTIATLTGNNGLLTKVTDAKRDNIVGTEKEKIAIAYNEYQIYKHLSENKQFSMNSDTATVEPKGDNGWDITFKKSNNKYTLDKDGNISFEGIDESENEGQTIINIIDNDHMIGTCTLNTKKASNVQISVTEKMDECDEIIASINEVGLYEAINNEAIYNKFGDEAELTEMHPLIIKNYESNYGNASFSMIYDAVYSEGANVMAIMAIVDDNNNIEFKLIDAEFTEDNRVNFIISKDILQEANGKDSFIGIISEK